MFEAFAAILDGLPNGLHDARLTRLDLGVGSGVVVMELVVWIGLLRSDDYALREATRAAVLTFSGVGELCVWPDAMWLGNPEPIDASPEVRRGCPDERIAGYAGPGGVASFWLSDAATNLEFTAEHVEFRWIDEG